MYVFLGVTGQTGAAVAGALLGKNRLVRVVLRSDKTAAAGRAKGVDTVFVDLSDAETMTNAMQNGDAVYAMNHLYTTSPTCSRGREELASVNYALIAIAQEVAELLKQVSPVQADKIDGIELIAENVSAEYSASG